MVKIDKSKCIDCGACAATCPEVFETRSDGKTYVKPGADVKKNAKGIKEAIENCAVKAISN